MKKIIILIILFAVNAINAQNGNSISIDWLDGNYAVNENYKIILPHFISDFRYNDGKKSISFSKNIGESPYIEVSSLRMTNVVFESVSREKLGNLDLNAIPKDLNASIQNMVARDINYGILSFSPIIKEGNSFKRVKSLSYSYTIGAGNRNLTSKSPNAIVNSVLKTGEWRRFYIEKSGVYKISKAFLNDLGFNTGVDPRTIKIYGNGGRMIPLLNSTPYPIDLAENAVYFNGEQDGVFNDEDYILFYAEGVDNWNDDSKTHVNLYADKSYYYVTSSAGNGKRMSPILESTQPPDVIFTSFDDYQFHEVDNVNIVRVGRKWFGEAFNVNNQQNFDFTFPNMVSSSTVSVKVHVAASAVVNTSFNVKINSQDFGNIICSANNSAASIFGSEAGAGTGGVQLPYSFTNSSPNISVVLSYNNAGVPSALGYLDYIALNTKSYLKGFGKQFRFQVNATGTSIGTCEYQVSNASNLGQIWDITDIYNVTSKINNGQSQIAFRTTMGQTRKYIAVDNSDIYSPIKDTNYIVPNQDLKGTVFLNSQGVFQDIDYIIVTPYSLLAQAERLANFHRAKSNLNVKVMILENLYGEFSSGKQDIGAIRNFVKYVYDNASDPSKRVKYLCLFGDASFDFKNRIPNNTNIVPIYEAIESFSIIGAFISDDYFGFMENNEGNMDNGTSNGLDIAVGRILASSLTQADQMVSKVIDYHDEKSYGRWRDNIVMISDDVDRDSDGTLEIDLDKLTDAITDNKLFINAKKIHLDSYVQETTSGGQKYPKASEDFINAFAQGALMFDYFGHGNEDVLSGERVFEKADAINLSNKYRYPLFVTVTCEFTRFDNPYRATAGEYVYWNPSGGAVSMITTTRLVGQSTGSTFNLKLGKNLFSYGSNNYVSIAEAVRMTKRDMSDNGNNVIFYIGDPALKLAIPKPQIRLTKINDVPITQPVDVLQALSFVKLSGEVTDEFGNPLPNYNGEL
ncbi:MAG: type IX secretion system sortase PorU, partial [Flavobacterium sp.]